MRAHWNVSAQLHKRKKIIRPSVPCQSRSFVASNQVLDDFKRVNDEDCYDVYDDKRLDVNLDEALDEKCLGIGEILECSGSMPRAACGV